MLERCRSGLKANVFACNGLPTLFFRAEGSHSGRVRSLGKRVYPKGITGSNPVPSVLYNKRQPRVLPGAKQLAEVFPICLQFGASRRTNFSNKSQSRFKREKVCVPEMGQSQ